MTADVTAPTEVIRSLNLGEWAVTANREETLTCLGLGSCVALAIHDSTTGIAGMAHIVLPDSTQGRPSTGAKFGDLAVPLLVGEMQAAGAKRPTMRVYLAGGAQVLKTAAATPMSDIGERNADSIRAGIRELGLRVHGEDIGGDRGRTVRLRVDNGELEVSRAGEPARLL